jgi:outer membrane protein TolC
MAGNSTAAAPGPLLDILPAASIAVPNFDSHPVARAQAAAVETIRAREAIIAHSYFPRFNFQTAFFGRGTGALTSGRFEGGAHGLLPNTANWATGMTITFPLFDIFSLRSRRRIEENNEAAERARYDQTIQILKSQYTRAKTLVDSALRIAENTPVGLKAAQDAEARARARYEAQLASVIEVAEAQRLLAQAEIDNAVARLGVWRSLPAASRVQGDLTPFLQQVLTASGQRR